MDPELAGFLESRVVDFAQELVWRGGKYRFQLRGYFTSAPPPDAFVLAGRAIVLDGERVLVVRDPDNEHVTPGGRREPGETALDAAYREVLEETGWLISNPFALSVIHLHYETPEPVNVAVGRYIYPDFLWQIFVANPNGLDSKARHTDGYEIDATFRPIAEMLQEPLEPFQRILLQAAVRARASRAT
jgi:8-oxo-dGTP diphosphatase